MEKTRFLEEDQMQRLKLQREIYKQQLDFRSYVEASRQAGRDMQHQYQKAVQKHEVQQIQSADPALLPLTPILATEPGDLIWS